MMLKEKIAEDLKNALKSGDSLRRSVLGMVLSAMHNKEIELGKPAEGLSDEDVMAVITSEAKKRKDSIYEFSKAGRDEMAAKEEKELAILNEYLPAQLSAEEIAVELKKVIEETGSNKKADFGRLMGEAMRRLKGRAEGSAIKAELEKLLE